MKCPFCGVDDTQVLDTRVVNEVNGIRRRRRCRSCGERFNTLETAETRMPMIIKSTGDRVAFDEAKLRRGLIRALHKRPVSADDIDATVEKIKQSLLQNPEREVPSRVIGEAVMEALLRLDIVAYIRFASVYKSFADVEAFRREIASLPDRGSQSGDESRRNS